MTFDCMTPEEFELWADQTARNRSKSPCYDCPLEFHLAEVALGRCESRPGLGRPLMRARATWDNVRAGRSDQQNRIARDARLSATTREAGVVGCIEVVAR